MKVVRLQITQQMAQLGVESQDSQMNIESNKRTLEVESQPAKMSAISQGPAIKLDLSAFHANFDIKDIATIARENAQNAKAAVTQYIQKTASDADYVANCTIHVNRLASVAKSDMLASKVPPMNSGVVPDGAIPMKGIPGKTAISWSDYSLKISWDEEFMPELSFEPPSVEVYMKQKAFIEVSTIEEYIPARTGKQINALV